MERPSPDNRNFVERFGPVLLVGGPLVLLAGALASGWREPAVWVASASALLALGMAWPLVTSCRRRLADETRACKAAENALDSQSDALFLEPTDGGAAYANHAMRKLLDIPPGALPSTARLEALGRGVEDAVGALKSATDAASRIAEATDGTAYEVSVSPSDGGRIWRLHKLDGNQEGNGWTDRLEAHGRTAAAGLYTLDPAGRFLYVNPTMAQWLGRHVSDILGSDLRINDVLYKETSDDPMRPGVGMLSIRGANETVWDLQVSHALADGPQGQRIHGVARPVGPAGSAAQRFQRLFHEMPVGVALVDQRMRIGDCNETFEQLIGDSSVKGKAILDYVKDDEKIVIAKELQALLEGQSAAKSLDVRISGPSEAVTSIFAGRLQDDLDRPTGLVLLVIDNTEQKTLETQLAQSQKMQAVGQLAGGIAHDFNNVLTAMIGFCDLLLQRHRPGDQSFADIMQIKQNANRAAALVRQLLAFSRQQTLQPRLLNVTEVLAELSNLLRRLLGEKIELSMVHGRDLGLVKGDQGQLEQVIINLAVNARDAMDGGGKLTIETKNAVTTRARQAHGEVMPSGEYVQISVRDTGIGIPKQNFSRIFEPFFTTKEVGSGTGLGLSTVYGIIKQTGGYLFVDSSGPGKGTVFDIFLQRQQADMASAVDGVPSEVAADLTGGGTVLLVEDEDPVRLFSARALRNKGYKVVEAKTGEAALELLDGGPYDLLVTDMVMPRVDGAQVIRAARKLLPDLPVICISGYTEESVLKEVESLDKLRFLSKPFSLKQLAGAVKEAIEKNAQPTRVDGA